MYFLQKDDIMLHFTQKGSSDVTGCQLQIHKYVFLLVFVYISEHRVILLLKLYMIFVHKEVSRQFLCKQVSINCPKDKWTQLKVR